MSACNGATHTPLTVEHEMPNGCSTLERCHLFRDGDVVAVAYGKDTKDSHSFGRRLADCFNACAGVSGTVLTDKEIEAIVHRTEPTRHWQHTYAREVEQTVLKALRQRAGLWAEKDQATLSMDDTAAEISGLRSERDQLQAAIAKKLEGGK